MTPAPPFALSQERGPFLNKSTRHQRTTPESTPILPFAEDDIVPANPDASVAIFDHDGVLVDSLEFHKQAWLELGNKTGLRFTSEFIQETFGMTNPSIFRRLLGDAISVDEIARYSDLKEVCYREVARGRIRLMAGVREVLDALSARGVKLAIGSSGPRANLELTVTECGLDGRFAAITSIEDITRGKPDPQVFLVAAAKAGVDPARSVVFEDAPVGIQAAKAAGMYAVGLTTTHPAQALAEAGADQVVDNLAGYDVGRLVDRLQARATEEVG
jgi:HAD superfamily hydrolase (TIGR01509 family)